MGRKRPNSLKTKMAVKVRAAFLFSPVILSHKAYLLNHIKVKEICFKITVCQEACWVIFDIKINACEIPGYFYLERSSCVFFITLKLPAIGLQFLHHVQRIHWLLLHPHRSWKLLGYNQRIRLSKCSSCTNLLNRELWRNVAFVNNIMVLPYHVCQWPIYLRPPLLLESFPVVDVIAF